MNYKSVKASERLPRMNCDLFFIHKNGKMDLCIDFDPYFKELVEEIKQDADVWLEEIPEDKGDPHGALKEALIKSNFRDAWEDGFNNFKNSGSFQEWWINYKDIHEQPKD